MNPISLLQSLQPSRPQGPLRLSPEQRDELLAVFAAQQGALQNLVQWCREAEDEIGGPLPVGYRANVQKAVVFAQAQSVLNGMRLLAVGKA